MLQVLGRTLSMQFDNNWTAVEDVVVDKLGKYAYAIPWRGWSACHTLHPGRGVGREG